MQDYAPTCSACQNMYSSREPSEKPPCQTCRVLPTQENEDALKIWQKCKFQFRMGFSGPVDIDHVAIHKAIDRYGIKDDVKCFDKVLIIGRWWLNKLNDKKGR